MGCIFLVHMRYQQIYFCQVAKIRLLIATSLLVVLDGIALNLFELNG